MPISTYLRGLREKLGTTLLQIPAVAAIIHDEAGRILLQRSSHNEWSLPAGAIDLGESPAQAVVREVWEETGLKVRPVNAIGIFGGCNGFRHTYPNGDEVEYTCIVLPVMRSAESCVGAMVKQFNCSISILRKCRSWRFSF